MTMTTTSTKTVTSGRRSTNPLQRIWILGAKRKSKSLLQLQTKAKVKEKVAVTIIIVRHQGLPHLLTATAAAITAKMMRAARLTTPATALVVAAAAAAAAAAVLVAVAAVLAVVEAAAAAAGVEAGAQQELGRAHRLELEFLEVLTEVNRERHRCRQLAADQKASLARRPSLRLEVV
jgi:hypothetical protein